MYQIESKCIQLNPILANCFKMFSNVSISIQKYPIVSKYIQKLNLTFKATNKDNTIDFTIVCIFTPILNNTSFNSARNLTR